MHTLTATIVIEMNRGETVSFEGPQAGIVYRVYESALLRAKEEGKRELMQTILNNIEKLGK